MAASMSVVYVLTTPIPEDGGDDPTVKQNVESSKELWDSLEAKYMVEDASNLRFSSGKIVSLFNVLHVLNIRKNLVSSSVLNNCGYKQVIESNKFVLSKHGVFIGFGYLSNQMFRLSHVHFKRMQDMSKDWLIPTFDIDTGKWNKKYFVTFIDDASRFCYVSLLHTKNEALDKLKVFKTEVKLHQRSLIKRFKTDRGAEHYKAFRFYVIKPNDSVLINSIIESRDAIFDENRFSSVPRPSLRIPNETEDIGGSVVLEEVTEEVLADLPPGCKPLGCKWIFKRKPKVDGTIKKFKARLVIQGFNKSQEDYFDTYALVARISTIRLLIAMASIPNLIIHQIDVKTTFLNGDLEEEVYMNQPQGFIMPDNENKVL
ncbi:zinc finger, CCHC-type containing protein, partial [Tanacetum coccineum]